MQGFLILGGIVATTLASYLTTRRQLQLEKRQTVIENNQLDMLARLGNVEGAVEESAKLVASKTLERDEKVAELEHDLTEVRELRSVKEAIRKKKFNAEKRAAGEAVADEDEDQVPEAQPVSNAA